MKTCPKCHAIIKNAFPAHVCAPPAVAPTPYLSSEECEKLESRYAKGVLALHFRPLWVRVSKADQKFLFVLEGKGDSGVVYVLHSASEVEALEKQYASG